MKNKLMQGNEACAEGALRANLELYAGYPITPSTEIAEYLAKKMPKQGSKFIQMEDEISSMAAIIGASVAGAKAMTATSGPGFSLKQENLGYAVIAEVPCVVVNVQRSGPSTGLPTSPSQGDVMQAKWGTHGDHSIIALSPSSVKETYLLTVRAFNLAEKYRTPVILLMDEIVGHMRENIKLSDLEDVEVVPRKIDIESKLPYSVKQGEWAPDAAPFGFGLRYHVTGLVHGESGFPSNSPEIAHKLCRRLIDKIEKNYDDIVEIENYHLENAKTAVICYGGTARCVKEAIKIARKKHIPVGMLRLVTVWPFAAKHVEEVSKKVDRIIVAEHNDGQIKLEVERVAKNNCKVDFIGKIDGTLITPAEILKKIKE